MKKTPLKLEAGLEKMRADDVGSNRRSAASNKTRRVHNLLAEAEWHQLPLFEFTLDAADIREQYPLQRGVALSRQS